MPEIARDTIAAIRALQARRLMTRHPRRIVVVRPEASRLLLGVAK